MIPECEEKEAASLSNLITDPSSMGRTKTITPNVDISITNASTTDSSGERRRRQNSEEFVSNNPKRQQARALGIWGVLAELGIDLSSLPSSENDDFSRRFHRQVDRLTDINEARDTIKGLAALLLQQVRFAI